MDHTIIKRHRTKTSLSISIFLIAGQSLFNDKKDASVAHRLRMANTKGYSNEPIERGRLPRVRPRLSDNSPTPGHLAQALKINQ